VTSSSTTLDKAAGLCDEPMARDSGNIPVTADLTKKKKNPFNRTESFQSII
jgi:hypothetical protein